MSEIRKLPSDVSVTLAEFARACRAAARAVALYPPGHRAVDDAVTRLTEVARRAAGEHGLAIDVMPSDLRIGGAQADRDDAGIRELASLLHGQQIGGLTLHATADRESWLTLLGLMSRSADDNRRDGGLASLWRSAGGPSIELHAIDYAALLREGHGGSLARLLKAANEGALASLSLEELESIIAAVEANIQRRGAKAEDEAEASESAGRAIARLAALVLTNGAQADPARVEAALQRLAQLTMGLTAEGMNGLLAARASMTPDDPDARGATAVIDHLDANGKGRFVAAALAAEGSATARLREAFEALVPADERRSVASIADAALPDAAAPEEVPRLRQELDNMVVSYDDSRFVGGAYAKELTAARGRAQDLEEAKPDPPERVEQWISTVSDSALRTLDLQVLSDLLSIEQPPDQFEAIAQQAATRFEELVRVGLIDAAFLLEEPLRRAQAAGGARGDAAGRALARLGTAAVVRDLMPIVRRAKPGEVERVIEFLQRLGPGIAGPLATTLAQEQDASARERLRVVLSGFGEAGEQAVRALLSSENAEARRNAALLLRDFGGAASVEVLERLLGDSDLRVRREALRALAVVDDPKAHARIINTIETSPAAAQSALLDELGLVRDGRATPLLAALASRWRERRLTAPAMRAISQLGNLGASAAREGVDVLGRLIEATQWWSPGRARAVREQAAESLAAIGTPDARAALDAAIARRGKGARAAEQALSRRQS